MQCFKWSANSGKILFYPHITSAYIIIGHHFSKRGSFVELQETEGLTALLTIYIVNHKSKHNHFLHGYITLTDGQK